MIGVKFNRAMRPYGAGDVAMLPEDVAQRIVDDGHGELHEMPSNPHAAEPVAAAAPAQICAPPKRQRYLTKRFGQ